MAGRGGGSVVDEDGGDGGGGEGVGVEEPGAGRGAVDEQRELLAELFRVVGAGLAGGVGEPRGDRLLVVARVLGRGVAGATSKAARSRSRGVRSVRSNTPDRTEGPNRRRYSATSSSLPWKCW
ncbi:hypothetical protein [Streptomyces sp. NPDC102360]|uniref:hypothetical protein n=1 Tax=Streptomyces sp. NPDC102360 TaxID=3366160 RepID=UPI0037F68D36